MTSTRLCGRVGFVLAIAWSCAAPLPQAAEPPQLIEGEVALRAHYVQRFPCSSPVPVGLASRETPRANDWECSAVVATVAALDSAAKRPGDLADWGEVPVRCVPVIPMRFIELNGSGAKGSLQGYWSVEFWNTHGQGARGVIQVPSGVLEVSPLYNEFGVSLEKHCPAT